jgi:hypothetical protein
VREKESEIKREKGGRRYRGLRENERVKNIEFVRVKEKVRAQVRARKRERSWSEKKEREMEREGGKEICKGKSDRER